MPRFERPENRGFIKERCRDGLVLNLNPAIGFGVVHIVVDRRHRYSLGGHGGWFQRMLPQRTWMSPVATSGRSL
jgi:hypothetical protein